MRERVLQIVKFSFVGGINTLVSLIIYYGMVCVGIDFMISTVVGYIGSSLIGYILNRFWVFQVKQTKLVNSLLKYYVVYGSSLMINIGCMYLWVNILSISEMWAPIITLFVTVPYNYIFSKVWIFSKRGELQE